MALTMRLHPITLPMRHTFRVAHGARSVQHNLIVELADGAHRGFGEGAGIPYYGVTPRTMADALDAARDAIDDADFDDPAEFWRRLVPRLEHQLFALCALDEAAHDLWAKRHGKPVHELLGLDMADAPRSDYTIGIDTIEKMVAKVEEFAGWPIYKIKLGTDDDLAIVRELRRHTDAVFRVDANTAWTAEQTLANAEAMKPLGVEFIEQPMPPDAWDDMMRVREACVLPVIADESCIVEADVERCAAHFHGVNVKLTKCGGMTPARRMLTRARELGLKTMVGCMTESTVGISAIAQLLPMLDYVDMDGAVLLGRDVAAGVRLDRGRAVLPDTPGNGVTIDEPALADAKAAYEEAHAATIGGKTGIAKPPSLEGGAGGG